MTITATDIKFVKSTTVSDASANGGRMGSVVALSNVGQAVFPDVTNTERLAGSTKYRKLFLKNDNASNEGLSNTKLSLVAPTPADDRVLMFSGTFIDTQADIASPALYGAGKLNASVAAGVTSIVVQVEDWASAPIFRNGDVIRITDKLALADAGNEEYVTISGAPAASGNLITLTLATPLVYAYNSANTYVASVLSLGLLKASVEAWVETTGSGAFDELTPGNFITPNIGAIYQNWTLTFTSGTTFTLVGDSVGSLAAGTRSGNYSPTNPLTGTPYFTISAAGWAGSWIAGDTITFRTLPAAKPVWYKRVVPAGAASLAGNSISQVVVGEN